jgi:predicted N-formylglutamate amidohydrolase
MNHTQTTSIDDHIKVMNPEGQSPVVVVCEHASFFIPAVFEDLGLAIDALQSHAVWDPGALGVANGLASCIDATVIASGVSRLVYDCNRPPSSPDAMPHQSEAIRVPGNMNLTTSQRQARTDSYYKPFHTALTRAVAAKPAPVIVTIHSFTPVYHGRNRAVEIGVLHDSDSRLADAMLQIAPEHTDAVVLRNAPYGPEHGVTHTLKEHALPNGHLNVMLEIRNDLIQNADQQGEISKRLAKWLSDALALLQVTEAVQCQA